MSHDTSTGAAEFWMIPSRRSRRVGAPLVPCRPQRPRLDPQRQFTGRSECHRCRQDEQGHPRCHPQRSMSLTRVTNPNIGGTLSISHLHALQSSAILSHMSLFTSALARSRLTLLIFNPTEFIKLIIPFTVQINIIL